MVMHPVDLINRDKSITMMSLFIEGTQVIFRAGYNDFNFFSEQECRHLNTYIEQTVCLGTIISINKGDTWLIGWFLVLKLHFLVNDSMP